MNSWPRSHSVLAMRSASLALALGSLVAACSTEVDLGDRPNGTAGRSGSTANGTGGSGARDGTSSAAGSGARGGTSSTGGTVGSGGTSGDGTAAGGTATTVAVHCGDGIVDAGESCDDGNRVGGDGCSSTCQLEAGTGGSPGAGGSPGTGGVPGSGGTAAVGGTAGCGEAGAGSCGAPTCGDGIVQAGEECDDGNAVGGDGCSADCSIEPGFTCGGPAMPCVPAAN